MRYYDRVYFLPEGSIPVTRRTRLLTPMLLALVFCLTAPLTAATISYQIDQIPEFIQLFASAGGGEMGRSCAGGACDITIPFPSSSLGDGLVVVTLLDPSSGAVNDVLTFEQNTTAELSFSPDAASIVLAPGVESAVRPLMVIDRGGDVITLAVGPTDMHSPEPGSIGLLGAGILAVVAWRRLSRKAV